jgi:hypothetical protein
MLTVNQKQRIDASQALHSKWLSDHENKNTEHRPDFIKRIKQFNAKRKFKGGVKAIIATNKLKNLLPPSTSATSNNSSVGSSETPGRNSTSNNQNQAPNVDPPVNSSSQKNKPQQQPQQHQHCQSSKNQKESKQKGSKIRCKQQ